MDRLIIVFTKDEWHGCRILFQKNDNLIIYQITSHRIQQIFCRNEMRNSLRRSNFEKTY